MAQLHFPGGPVTIDQSQIWRELSTWLGSGWDRQLTVRVASDSLIWATLHDGVHVRSHVGHSRLGLADAVAQALQMSLSTEQDASAR